jgi:hypothetical protein
VSWTGRFDGVERKLVDAPRGDVCKPERQRQVRAGLVVVRIPLHLQHVSSSLRRLSRRYGDTCAICLESWKDTDEVSKFEPCGHLFHSDCISEWIRRKSTCPTCRTDVCDTWLRGWMFLSKVLFVCMFSGAPKLDWLTA